MEENVNFGLLSISKCRKLFSIVNILYCLSLCYGNVEEVTVDVQWTSAIRLSEYNGFHSVNLVSFYIPESTLESIWDIQGTATSKSCPAKSAQVYFQHGGYPLVSPYNESYPENFFLNRTDLQQLTIQTKNVSVFHRLRTPKSGNWFMAAFLPKSKEKITQKGLGGGHSCGYGIGVRLISKVLSHIEDIPMDISSKIRINAPTTSRTFRLMNPDDITSYSVSVYECAQEQNGTMVNTTTCPIEISLSSNHLPSSQSDTSINCTNITTCQLTMDTPTTVLNNYLTVKVTESLDATALQFYIRFSVLKCYFKYGLAESRKLRKGNHVHSYDTLNHVMKHYKENNSTNSTDQTLHFVHQNGSLKSLVNFITNPDWRSIIPLKMQESCLLLPSLGNLRLVSEDFTSLFLFPDILQFPQPENQLFVPDQVVLVSSFEIRSARDAGGTLRVKLKAAPNHWDSTQDVVVWLCIMKNVLPGKHVVQNDCNGGIMMSVNTTKSANKMEDILYMPYPEEATWYIGMYSICFNKNSSNPEHCKQFPLVSIEVLTTRCVNNKCGSYGRCQEFISGLHVFSSCTCFGGWRGYGCSDGTEAEADSALLRTVLLLTLSNLLFIPGIILAVYRRYFIEALIYFFTMFFSTFYHACDTSDINHSYCMMKYDVLSFCDFLGSIMSFWVTILAMARLSKPVRSFFHMVGALGLAFGVEYDRHGLWVFVVPAATGVAIMAISWVRQCYTRKKLYPSKWRYIKFLLPGVLFAGLGLVIFAFLETEDNYEYTHSAWHIVMALSIIFLLPSRPMKKDVKPYMQLQARGPESVRLLDDYSDDNIEDDIMISDASVVQDNGRNIVL